MTWRANWCSSCGGGANYGDQLTPALLARYGIPYEWAKPARANLFAVGSIASKIPNRSNPTIIGTGLIRADMHKDLSRARILALRGPLTAKRCNVDIHTTAYGDLGLLTPDLIARTPSWAGDHVAILPHYVDDTLWATHRSAGARRLRITDSVVAVTEAIARSRLLITSSLHALITADALGIPHAYFPHPRVIGGRFKFDDYAASLDTDLRAGVTHLTDRKTITAKQEELRSLIQQLHE